jgi:hypothetical protein
MLELVAPTDGDRFAVGEPVVVEVEATDDIGVQQVKLYRGDTLVGTDIDAPYTWTLDELEEGVVELHAIGIDAAGQSAQSDVVAIAIGDVELPDDAGGESDDGGALTIGSDAGELPEDGDRDTGCSCRAPARGLGGSALFVVLACRRRRRISADSRASPD